MAWTHTDVETIETAIARGESSVRYADGRQVDYRSVKELLDARDAIKNALAGASGGVRCTVASFTKD